MRNLLVLLVTEVRLNVMYVCVCLCVYTHVCDYIYACVHVNVFVC